MNEEKTKDNHSQKTVATPMPTQRTTVAADATGDRSSRSFWMIAISIIAAPFLLYFGMFRQDAIMTIQIALIAGLIMLAAYDAWWMLLGAVVVRSLTEAFQSTPVFSLSSVSFNLSAMTGVIVIVWALSILFRYRAQLNDLPFRVPMLIFFGIQALSVFWSIAPPTTFEELVRIVSVAVLFGAAWVILRNRPSVSAFVPTLAAALVVPSVFGLVQWLSGTGLQISGEPNRAFGTFTHPNTFGLALAIVIAACTFHLVVAKEKRSRWTIAAVIGFSILLLLSYSRGAWLVLALTFALVGLRYYRNVLLRLLAVVALLFLLFTPMNNFLFETWNIDLSRLPVANRILVAGSDEGSVRWRVALWKSMERNFAERPLQGFGLATFPIVLEQQEFLLEGYNAHNDYLRLALETGILGLAGFVLLYGTIIATVVRRYRAAVDPQVKFLLFGTLALTIGLLVESFFENVLQATYVMWLYWLWLAYVLSLEVKKKEG